jgi:hypothetical protein
MEFIARQEWSQPQLCTFAGLVRAEDFSTVLPTHAVKGHKTGLHSMPICLDLLHLQDVSEERRAEAI